MENVTAAKNKNTSDNLYDAELAAAAVELFALLDEADASDTYISLEQSNAEIEKRINELNGENRT
ncbi:MAG: hypothetical protein LBP26_06455 [Clostridiales bacterium]|jgi:hypothetical protein|nr:hypothetical protein [Clostridiales bacterium]